eukprot:TRINITY_DN14948_c0_g1_i1.p1 TRINITY_DN14948_c0_g1~~TRINITY_DN14948_c0_g1_i1.p1  ORF type:complete len:182 (-),score=44.66 TRINITY_DN14948_c0_g1_i1:203-748(-)
MTSDILPPPRHLFESGMTPPPRDPAPPPRDISASPARDAVPPPRDFSPSPARGTPTDRASKSVSVPKMRIREGLSILKSQLSPQTKILFPEEDFNEKGWSAERERQGDPAELDAAAIVLVASVGDVRLVVNHARSSGIKPYIINGTTPPSAVAPGDPVLCVDLGLLSPVQKAASIWYIPAS